MVYTEESLGVLGAAVAECEQVLSEGKATQAEVNSYLETLEAAYNALVKYIAPTKVYITVPENQDGVTVPNDGYVRKTARTLTNTKIQLDMVVNPEDAIYKEITWSSSNDAILVDDSGLVTNTISGAKAADITVTVTAYDGNTVSDTIHVSFVRAGVTKFEYANDMVFGPAGSVKVVRPTTDELGIADTTLDSSYLTECTTPPPMRA
jgi:hypothetical protein